MKTKLTLLLIVNFSLIFLNSFSQVPSIQWQKSLGGSNSDRAYAIEQTSDGGYVFAGKSSSNDGDVSGNHGNINDDFWVVKLDNAGTIQWQKSLGGTDEDAAYSIQQTTDGGYIVAGYSASNDGDVSGNHGSHDYWVVKLDNAGGITWQKSLGGTDSDEAYSVQQTSDGGYIVAGNTYSTDGNVTVNNGSNDYWVVKLDNAGTITWQKSLGGTNEEWAFSIQQTSNGGYIVTGHSASTNGDVTGNHGGSVDYWVVNLDNSGGIVWQKSLGGTDSDYAYSIQQTSDGGYVVAGGSFSTDGDVTGHHDITSVGDFWIVKLDNTGGITWQKSLGGTLDDEAYSIQQTTDGGYIVAGYSYSNDGDLTANLGSTDYWVVKLDNTGGIAWQKSFGGTDLEKIRSIQQTTNGGYVMVGYSLSNDADVTGNHGNSDVWVVKLEGTVGIDNMLGNTELSIYPNPFVTTCNLETILSINTIVQIEIKNTLGQIVYAFNEKANGGLYKRTIDVNLSQGIYYLTLQTNEGLTTKKIEVVK